MQFAVLFLAVIAAVYASPVENNRYYDPNEENMYRIRYLLVEDQNGYYRYEDLLKEVPSARASASDVTFYLYTQNNINSPNIIAGDGVDSLSSTNFQSSRRNVFVSHGWNNNYQSDVNAYIINAILSVHDVNLFIVDWSGIANGLYLTAQSNVPTVGVVIGDFIYSTMTTYELSSSNFNLIGHSLGAHIAGCAGARVRALSNTLVSTIVGLDPAGPLFTLGNIDNRIDPTDGAFVQIIHTNGGLLGFSSSIGHSDYFPNGGSSQPGCGLDLVGSCAHGRAYLYYAESILTSGFGSRLCNSISNLNNGNCNSNQWSLMGQLDVDTSVSGDFYLNTNSASPYAMG